ncbi:MAG: threonine synthase [Endomicrobia bacterium]|nr:threonine synthase [Endomicrobiia bacterium]
MNNFFFKCIVCEKEFDRSEVSYTCPACGNNLEVLYDYIKVLKQFLFFSTTGKYAGLIWKYLPFLPLKEDEVINKICIYHTPLVKSINIQPNLGIKGLKLFFKDDTKLPSGSLKDRASAVVAAYALQNKKEKIITASTGNAGCALACISAMVGVKPLIVVPRSAPEAKLVQITVYGAEIIKYNGSYDECFEYVLKLCEKHKSYFNRSTGVNPFTREGKKTVSLEIWEQLGNKVPDFIFVPVGDGNIISGVWKGFKDLYFCGLIKVMPRLIAVQATGSNSISLTFSEIKQRLKGGHKLSELLSVIKLKKVKSKTLADSISVDLPRDGYAAIKAVFESCGDVVEVTDKEIVSAIKLLASKEGIFAEPAAAASFAGFLKYSSTHRRVLENKKVVVLITGHGLKDISAISKN